MKGVSGAFGWFCMSALKVVLGEQYSWKLQEQVLASGDGDED